MKFAVPTKGDKGRETQYPMSPVSLKSIAAAEEVIRFEYA